MISGTSLQETESLIRKRSFFLMYYVYKAIYIPSSCSLYRYLDTCLSTLCYMHSFINELNLRNDKRCHSQLISDVAMPNLDINN